jgi:DNA-directed RNA polymerase specialized sigma24 family protein
MRVYQRDLGWSVKGDTDWCLAFNYRTQKAYTFGEDEIDRVRALVERINRQLKERGRAEEEEAALLWLYEHKNELRESRISASQKDYHGEFKPEDVEDLVESADKEWRSSRDLNKFEKAVIRRTLESLSPLERKVFLLSSVWMIPIPAIEELLGQKVRQQHTRIKRKLEKARKNEKTPTRYR